MSQHSKRADSFIKDEARTDWHDKALWHVREKRDASAEQLPEWELLRETASQVKDNVLSNLDNYLIQFEAEAKKNGVIVHWAEDAADHNQIIGKILEKHNARKIVKSKSMLTEECKLNDFLEEKDIEIIDTDLGERIIQLRKEPPSHVVLPAIHIKKEEVGELFHQKLGTEKGNSDPTYLTKAARTHLRNKFFEADAAITGVNFGIAETGGVVICTNEGNADMGCHSAPVQIHCMGIEKLLPQAEHLGVFIRLLARSATGQPSTIYTSHYHKPRPGAEMHVVIVDNGRSIHLGKEDFRNSLKCIRCGACMNTCPIYRRSGGHSYHSTIPGPIGAILSPNKNLKEYSDLPFASTLCGSCSNVCPVKIDIHEQLYKWRQEIYKNNQLPKSKTIPLKITTRIFENPSVYNSLGKIARGSLRNLPGFMIYNNFNTWGKQRDLPDAPKEGFKQWYKKNRNE
ncbi:lactate utilization protein B [Salegentibacter sp. F188]|uniref:Lactate utilization protein B n=1 Tax=Autumnicola patrickiae TaxID=3075591 RepID=A0ABU3DYY2_9FLAO|nr:lactate utilization protein B [Salegentibacter sp. F188]MDT0688940.1 lactate utilization protein B [Salegentibacter sp. F188]